MTKSQMMLVIFRAEYELVEIDLQIKIKLRKAGAPFTHAVFNRIKEEKPCPLTSNLLYQDLTSSNPHQSPALFSGKNSKTRKDRGLPMFQLCFWNQRPVNYHSNVFCQSLKGYLGEARLLISKLFL